MSDKPSSTKPSSEAPRISSSKPSSKMPKNEDKEDAVLASEMFRDMSVAPKQDKISSKISSKTSSSSSKPEKISSKISSSSSKPAKDQDKKAKSKFSTIPEDEELDENYDDFENSDIPQSNYLELTSPSKKPQSKVQSSSKYYNAKSSLPEKAKSVMASALFTDESRAPKVESKASKAKSVMASALFRDESRAPKVESKASKAKSVMPSAYFNDEPSAPRARSVMPSVMFKDESFVPKSFLVTKEDRIMSTRQMDYDDLDPEEQKEQEVWAQEQIKDMGACPEKYDWVRVVEGKFSGYICNDGRHGMTDQLIAEGHGALITLEVKKDVTKALFGPWYPHATIKNCYIYLERADDLKLEGIKEYDQPAFLGSEHQKQRAKWEFYSVPENATRYKKMNYKMPEKEPPAEWADEDNIPKTQEERNKIKADKEAAAKNKK